MFDLLPRNERVGFTSILGLYADVKMGSTRLSEVAIFLVEALPLEARVHFCAAHTKVTEDVYGQKVGGLPLKRNKDLLLALLMLSGSLYCCIDGQLAAEMAFDRQLYGEVRMRAALELLSRDFRSKPPPKFWYRLKRELRMCPDLACPVLHYFAEHDPVEVFRSLALLGSSVHKDPDLYQMPLYGAMERVRSCGNWQKLFRHLPKTTAKLVRSLVNSEKERHPDWNEFFEHLR